VGLILRTICRSWNLTTGDKVQKDRMACWSRWPRSVSRRVTGRAGHWRQQVAHIHNGQVLRRCGGRCIVHWPSPTAAAEWHTGCQPRDGGAPEDRPSHAEQPGVHNTGDQHTYTGVYNSQNDKSLSLCIVCLWYL